MKFLFLLSFALLYLVSCSSSPVGEYTFLYREIYEDDFVLYNTQFVVENDTIDYGDSEVKILNINFKTPDNDEKVYFELWERKIFDKSKVVLIHGGMKHPHFTNYSIGHRIVNSGYNCIFLDSRGYGMNEHLSKTFGTQEVFDINKTIESYKKYLSLDSIEVVLISTSMAGVSAISASIENNQIHAIIFESMIYDNEKTISKYLNWYEKFYFNIAYSDVKNKLSKINPKNTFSDLDKNLPLYFFWADGDDLIDSTERNMIIKLTDNSIRKMEFYIIPGGTHAIRTGYNLKSEDFNKYMDKIVNITKEVLSD
jgi:dienelactone hydrolase